MHCIPLYVPGLGRRESVPVRERCAKGLPQVLTVRAHTPGVKAKVTLEWELPWLKVMCVWELPWGESYLCGSYPG